MPIHDWTRVEAGDFHHFDQAWVVFLTNALDRGLLSPDSIAMTDQGVGRPIPDVVALQTHPPRDGVGGTALAPVPAARVAAYLAGESPTAFVESAGLGDPLPHARSPG